jgi:cellulose synthase operon protein YhjQ
MHRIAFLSPLGGVGRTTLAAHVATLLAQRGQPTLAIDLSPQNALGLHLGLQAPPAGGWHPAQGRWWGDCALENSAGVRLLPHGAWSGSVGTARHEPGWLQAQIAGLDLPPGSTVVLDTPPLPAPLALQAAQCASLAVLVVDASVRSLRMQGALRDAIAQFPAGVRWAVALTGADPRSAARREALHTLRAQWQEHLIPYPLHADEHLQGLADWIAQACGLDGAAP